MKLVVALALLSNAAAFMAPVQPRAAMQPLKAITTEVRSRVRDDVPSNSCTLREDARSSPRGECGCPLAIDARRRQTTHVRRP